MMEATLEQFSLNPRGFLRQAQGDRVLVTHEGKPVALLVGLENKDEEDFRLQTSPEFWRMIDQRRARPSRSLDDVEALLSRDEPKPS